MKKSNLLWINYAMAIALWHREQVLGIEIFSQGKMRFFKFFSQKEYMFCVAGKKIPGTERLRGEFLFPEEE